MKPKLKFLTLILTASVLLAGCFPTGEKETPGTSQPVGENNGGGYSAPTVDIDVNRKIDDVTFDYVISADLPTQAPKIKLKAKKTDAELLKNVFLSDKTITSEKVQGNQTLYNTSDDSVLAIYPATFTFRNGGIADRLKNFELLGDHYNSICYSGSEELKSFPRQDAVQLANDVLDKAGFENYGEPYIITVTPEMGNAYLEEHGGFLKDTDEYYPWTEDEGVYVLKYPLNVNGIDLSAYEIRTLNSGRTIKGPMVTVFVIKEGILCFDVTTTYDVVSENAGAADFKFSAEYASNALIDYYSKRIVDHPTFFTECKLEYIPLDLEGDEVDFEIVFTPAWCFNGYYTAGDTSFHLYFDNADYYYVETGIRYGRY